MPNIAGRSPGNIARQIYYFQTGDRGGASAALMKGVVQKLSGDDVIAIAATTPADIVGPVCESSDTFARNRSIPPLPAGALAGREIVTIESIVEDKNHPVVVAWIEEQVPQCGYCQAGQIMAATALLARHPQPTDADIDREMTNICRCGTYAEIRNGIRRASALMGKG